LLGLVLNAPAATNSPSYLEDAGTACLLAARAAQPSTLHVRGVRQAAASAEAAAAGASAGTTPTGRQATPHAPRPVRWRPRLNASGQLLIPGRRSEPGVFPSHLRVPPVRPAKHHRHHYRRGKPSGQADQHPPPQAHPNPKQHIPTPDTAVPSTHHTTSHASALRPSPLWRNHAHGSWATSPAAISAFLKLLVLLTSPHLRHAAITHPHQTWD
jgi:hypothetical protein